MGYFQDYNRLFRAIKKHYSQRGDDLCWKDHDELYAAAGLPPKDHTVGNKFEMLKNCVRYIDQTCKEGGQWRTYAELEDRIEKQKAIIAKLREQVGNQQAIIAALKKHRLDVERLLINFPGHTDEDSWYSWIAAKNQLFRGIKDETAARKSDTAPDA